MKEHTGDLINFMDKEKLEQTAVIGHSLGSIIAQELMITVPERVDRAVLISSTAKIWDNPTFDWILNGDGLFLGVNGYDKEEEIPDDFIKSWTETTNEDAGFQEAVYQHAKSLPYKAWNGIFKGCGIVDNTARLSTVTCPVEIIWGTGDTLFLKEDQELLQSSLSGVGLSALNIEGASHKIHWDSKAVCQQIAENILRFLSDDTG